MQMKIRAVGEDDLGGSLAEKGVGLIDEQK